MAAKEKKFPARASTKKKSARKKSPAKGPQARKNSSDPLDFEAKLWEAADKLRAPSFLQEDAAEYKHVVLGLIFLKYISDAFEEVHTRLFSQRASRP